MDPIKNSKEKIYKVNKIQSIFNNAVKINPKRKSDYITNKSNILFLFKKTDSNAETAGDSSNSKDINKKILPKSSLNIPKKKKICIKFKDLVVESNKSDDSDEHLELALMIKKRKFTTHKKVKIFECNNIKLDNNKDDKDDKNDKSDKDNNDKEKINKLKTKMSHSMNKVILGMQKEENKFIKKIKKKLFCC